MGSSRWFGRFVMLGRRHVACDACRCWAVYATVCVLGGWVLCVFTGCLHRRPSSQCCCASVSSSSVLRLVDRISKGGLCV